MGEIFTTPAKKPSPRWPGHLEGERRLCWGEELVPGAPLVPFATRERSLPGSFMPQCGFVPVPGELACHGGDPSVTVPCWQDTQQAGDGDDGAVASPL